MEEESQKDSRESTTKDQTSTKSPGTKTIEKTCYKHGKYLAKGVVILGNEDHVIWSKCPKCQEEEEKKQRRREEQHRIFLQKENLAKSGVPKRFMDKEISNLEFTKEPQRKILKIVKSYLKAILNGDYPSLILCGKPGTGKTHIGCALVKEVIRTDKRGKIVTTAYLMRRVKETYRKDSEYTEDDIYDFYGSLPLLVIDEVGVQFGSETEKLIFYEIINQRYNSMLPTVLISNLTSNELSGFIGERAFDRFKEDGGAILAFDWDSYRK